MPSPSTAGCSSPRHRNGGRNEIEPEEAENPQRRQIQPDTVPKRVAEYAQGAEVSGIRVLSVAGQVATDPECRTDDDSDFRAQAHQVFRNIKAIVQQAGGDMTRVVRLTPFFTDIDARVVNCTRAGVRLEATAHARNGEPYRGQEEELGAEGWCSHDTTIPRPLTESPSCGCVRSVACVPFTCFVSVFGPYQPEQSFCMPLDGADVHLWIPGRRDRRVSDALG